MRRASSRPARARPRSRIGARRTARSPTAVIAAAASVGYTKTFLWDIDTVDWKPIGDGGPTAEQIAAKVIGNAVNGSNVLFHLGGYETLRSLELIVPGLRDRGFTLTSLSDLLRSLTRPRVNGSDAMNGSASCLHGGSRGARFSPR